VAVYLLDLVPRAFSLKGKSPGNEVGTCFIIFGKFFAVLYKKKATGKDQILHSLEKVNCNTHFLKLLFQFELSFKFF